MCISRLAPGWLQEVRRSWRTIGVCCVLQNSDGARTCVKPHVSTVLHVQLPPGVQIQRRVHLEAARLGIYTPNNGEPNGKEYGRNGNRIVGFVGSTS